MNIKSILSIACFSIASFTLGAQVCPGGPTPINTGSSSFGGGSGVVSSTSSSINSSGGIANGGFLSELNRTMNSTTYQSVRESYNSIKGNPFLNNTPINGTVVTKRGDIIEDVPLQIDLYSLNVIATREDGEQIALDGNFYDKIIMPFEGEDLVFKTSNPDKPNQFYEVLYDDSDITFFKERKVRILKSSSYNAEASAKFSTKRNNYFIQIGDQDVVNVKLKKKDIFSMFPDSELIAMKDFAKRKGIKLKDESDYIAVFDGVNKSFE